MNAGIAKDAEARFDISNYELENTSHKEQIKK